LVLESTAAFLERAGRLDLLRARRRSGERVTVDGIQVHLRDQAPLHAGNVDLPANWSFEDLVELLNRQVFFWPGTVVEVTFQSRALLPPDTHFGRGLVGPWKPLFG